MHRIQNTRIYIWQCQFVIIIIIATQHKSVVVNLCCPKTKASFPDDAMMHAICATAANCPLASICIFQLTKTGCAANNKINGMCTALPNCISNCVVYSNNDMTIYIYVLVCGFLMMTINPPTLCKSGLISLMARISSGCGDCRDDTISPARSTQIWIRMWGECHYCWLTLRQYIILTSYHFYRNQNIHM